MHGHLDSLHIELLMGHTCYKNDIHVSNHIELCVEKAVFDTLHKLQLRQINYLVEYLYFLYLSIAL